LAASPSGSGDLSLTFNAYNDNTNWRYKYTGDPATRYRQTGGVHAWFNAPSGTAGNTITFTQAMTLNSIGRLGVGTTSPARTLVISNGGAEGLEIGPGNSSGDAAGAVSSIYYNRSTASYVENFQDASAHVWRISGPERARINASGQFLVGLTSSLGTAGTGQFVQAGSGGAGSAISADATSATFAYSVAWFAANRGADSAFNFINCTSDQYLTPQFRVQGNGTILATNTTVQSISDARTKENIRDATDGLEVILGLQPRRFDFKQGFGNGRKNVLGFVAQEIETVFPDAVSEAHLDPDKKDIAYKTVGPGELIPVLVKAIQELKAEFDAYKSIRP
jgi:hypothetical protein